MYIYNTNEKKKVKKQGGKPVKEFPQGGTQLEHPLGRLPPLTMRSFKPFN